MHTHSDGVVFCQECTGRWVVETLSGTTYLIDLDAMTQRRLPLRGELRRDNQTVPLLAINPVKVGDNMRMMIHVTNGVSTYRSTNLVTDVNRHWPGQWTFDPIDGFPYPPT